MEDDIPDIREPNDGAFVKAECRVGPSLDYVAEKCRITLEALWEAYNELAAKAPGKYEVHVAFTNGAVAFLALNNMLALANEPAFDDRLLEMTRDQFNSWLDRID